MPVPGQRSNLQHGTPCVRVRRWFCSHVSGRNVQGPCMYAPTCSSLSNVTIVGRRANLN